MTLRLATASLAIALLVLGWAATARTPATHATHQQIEVLTVGCPRDGDQVPVVVTFTGASQQQQTLTAPNAHIAPSVYRYDTTLSPGIHYLMAVTRHAHEKNGVCTGNTVFAVLANRDRHLIIPLREGQLLDEPSCVIAGTLPFEGVQVGLVRNSGGERPATVDDRAYYFDRLVNDKYALRITFADGAHADSVVDLSNGSHTGGAFCSGQNAIRNRFQNLSESRLAELAKNSTHMVPPNRSAYLTGGQVKALAVAFDDLTKSGRLADISPQQLRASVSTTDGEYRVGFYDAAPTGRGLIDILSARNYTIKSRTYFPGN